MRTPGHALHIDQLARAGIDSVIDVRSPAEFAEDHIPGALNCPVLDDAERARVGTLYKQTSQFEAKRLGAALVAKNIAHHLETVLAEKPRGWRALVYCWRGGKRSGAMTHVLREIGWDVRSLEGGYKAYRRHVVARLEEIPQTLAFRVVHGVTGCGKSRLIGALAAAGAQVLDLETLAAHRGSVLGDLPDRAQPSQKMFESLLLAQLAAFDRAAPVFVEGESRRIGRVQLPEALIARMRAADCVMLEADTATRVALLSDEYRHFFTATATLDAQLDCLVDLHGHARIAEWKALGAQQQWAELVRRLLEEHYDPAYKRSALRNFAQLPQAEILRVASPEPETFRRLARILIEERGAVSTGAAARAEDILDGPG